MKHLVINESERRKFVNNEEENSWCLKEGLLQLVELSKTFIH